jgi:hypothetical protein
VAGLQEGLEGAHRVVSCVCVWTGMRHEAHP